MFKYGIVHSLRCDVFGIENPARHNYIMRRYLHSNKIYKAVADIFPEYYILCVRDFNDYAKDSLDEWIYYLKNSEIPEHFTAPGLEKARKALLFDNLSDEDKKAYEYHLGQTRYEQNVVEDSYTAGELNESIRIILNCHRAGCSIEQIVTFTGFTKEKIIRIIETEIETQKES